MIYKTSKEWWEAVKYRASLIAMGLYGLVWHCVLCGIASIAVYVAQQVKAFFLRETKAGIIIAVLLALILGGWLTSFVRERSKSVMYEHRADSLSYELSKFTQAFEPNESVIIEDDTIAINYRYKE